MSPTTLPRGHCQFRAQPQAASLGSRTTGRVASSLCKGPEGLAPIGGGALSIAGAPGRVPEGERLEVLSANFHPLAPQQTFHSLPAETRPAGGSSERRSADLPFGLLLSSRKFLQSHIATAGPPQRERLVGCSCHRGHTGSCFLCSLTGSSCARRRCAVRPSRPARSRLLASPPLAPRHLHGSCLTATEGQRPHLPELSASPQPTTSRFICIRAAIGLCKSACFDNLTPAPGKGVEERKREELRGRRV